MANIFPELPEIPQLLEPIPDINNDLGDGYDIYNQALLPREENELVCIELVMNYSGISSLLIALGTRYPYSGPRVC